MLILKLLFKYIGKFLKFSTKWGAIMPVGIFIVFDFFINLFMHGLVYAFKELGITVFGAELVINKMVHLAIANSVEYGFISFLRIVISVYILYALIKFLTTVQIHISGAQARWSAMLISVGIVGIISMSSIAVYEGTFGFIPIKDSLVFLLMNIKPVLLGVFSSGTTITAPQVAEMVNLTLNNTNSS